MSLDDVTVLVGANGTGKATHHLRDTYRVIPRHGLSLRRGRWSARFAVRSNACLMDHRGRIVSGPGAGRT
jgi:hypothetical protein